MKAHRVLTPDDVSVSNNALSFRVERSAVEESLTVSVHAGASISEIARDVSRSTRCARSGQAFNMAAARC